MSTTEAGFGLSTAESTAEAVAEAVAAAMAALSSSSGTGDPPTLLAFVSATVARDVEEVRKEFVKSLPPGTPIHGLTSSAALLTASSSSGGGSKASAVGCLLLRHEGGNGPAFVTAYHATDGSAAVSQLKDRMEDPQAIFMGSTPGAEEGVLAALEETFPGVPVFGGTAADDELNGSWSVFCESEAASGTGVSLVGVGPSVRFGASMLGPYTPTEKTATATKTEGRRVFEIDGKPATDWVSAWLGSDIADQLEGGGLILPQTAQRPIGIRMPTSGEYVSCHCAAVGAKGEGHVDFFTPIPEGTVLTVMDSGDGPSTGYASTLNKAYETAREGMGGSDPPAAGILIYCGGMAIAVGDKLDDGLTSPDFAKSVGDMPMLGMTCFGEQARLPGEGKNVQRNLSLGMVLFG